MIRTQTTPTLRTLAVLLALSVGLAVAVALSMAWAGDAEAKKKKKKRPPAIVTAPATLPSGALLKGQWAVGGGDGDWMTTQVDFRIPLAASIPGTNAHHVEAGASTAECPAPGDAARGHLCVYTQSTGGASAFSEILNHPPTGGAASGAAPEGFSLFFYSTQDLSYRSGSWAVRAP